MQATGVQQRILVYCRKGFDSGAVQRAFEQSAIEEVHTFEEALNALRQGRFDYVISEQHDFLASSGPRSISRRPSSWRRSAREWASSIWKAIWSGPIPRC